jgi:hypothetical protein
MMLPLIGYLAVLIYQVGRRYGRPEPKANQILLALTLTLVRRCPRSPSPKAV